MVSGEDKIGWGNIVFDELGQISCFRIEWLLLMNV